MSILSRILRAIDRVSELAGHIGKWFALLLVLVASFDAIARHFFNAPTIWAYDTITMAGGTMYMLGAAYNYFHDAHTRVDIIYGTLNERKQALLNVVASIFLFFPLMVFMLSMAVQWAIRAWRINEVLMNSFWYPPAAPYRTIFAIGLLLLVLQGLARFVRDLYVVVKGHTID
jgi:TRAP-type mannitol/chloroaromatic compound transport system permease small subunit